MAITVDRVTSLSARIFAVAYSPACYNMSNVTVTDLFSSIVIYVPMFIDLVERSRSISVYGSVAILYVCRR